MKTLTLITALTLSGSLLAEHSPQQINQSFIKAAENYQAKAEKALESGNTHNAGIYTKLAAIKRDAAASKGGYDWTEYHKLTGQLKFDGKKTTHKKKYSTNDAAKRYERLAKKSQVAGDSEKAEIYTRMAEIKRAAGKSNGDFDWTEYHQLEAKLGKTNKKTSNGKPHTNNLIERAQKHAALANSTNKSGDSYASNIHTRLAAILIDSASKKMKQQKIDWSEHDELQELLTKHNQQ